MPAQTNTWTVGVLVVIAGVWALFAPSVRIIPSASTTWTGRGTEVPAT